MIKQLRIKNFRNLADLTINFLKQVAILSGRNELGKSNTLNALMWLITGTLLTDKWGAGENDIDSIVPKDAIKGIDPFVEIELDNGTTFAKEYITKYSKEGKVIGHTTNYYVNNVPLKESEFIDHLNASFNYEGKIKTSDIKPYNLFTDPLYALQKLDAKTLRKLLIELGCSVSNEELYELGFEDLRPYEKRYFGDWSVMRKNLTQQSSDVVKQIEMLRAKMQTTTTEPFDQAELDRLNDEKAKLVVKLKDLENQVDPEVAELQKQIEKKQIELDLRKETMVANQQATINTLNSEIKHKQMDLEEDYNQKTKDLKKQIEDLRSQILLEENKRNNYSKEIELLDKKTEYLSAIVKSGYDTKNNLAIKLAQVEDMQFEAVKCPICGTVINEDEEQQFEADKKQQLETLKADIEKASKEIEANEKELESAKAKIKELKKASLEAIDNVSKVNDELIQKIEEINHIKHNTTIENEIKELQDKLEVEKTEHRTIEIEQLEYDIKALKDKQNTLKSQTESDFITSKAELGVEIAKLDEQIGACYVKQSKAKEREEYKAQLNENQEKLNNIESLLAKVNDLIKTMISMVNEKATKITGMHFVMLEENLTRDGYKEVCYATIDDVPFKDINTASKMKYGIAFIDKLKDILGHNDFPILADRMEGIDLIDKIYTYTQNQLICTRVSASETMEVI